MTRATATASIPACNGGNPRRAGRAGSRRAQQVCAKMEQDTLPREAAPATQETKKDCAIMGQDTLRVEVPRPRRMADLRAISTRHPGDAQTQLDFDRCILAMIRACGACGEAADEASQEIRLFADLWYNGLRDQAAAHARLAVEHLRTLQRDTRHRRALMRLTRAACFDDDAFEDDSLASSVPASPAPAGSCAGCSVPASPAPAGSCAGCSVPAGSPQVENRSYPELEKEVAKLAPPRPLAPASPVPAHSCAGLGGFTGRRAWLVRLATRQTLRAETAEQAVERARAEAPEHVVHARATELKEEP